jgi:hypothetical protein
MHLHFTKKKIRFLIFFLLTIGAYFACTISLFTTNAFLIPLVSFVILFIGIYFLALDLHSHPTKWLRRGMGILVILQFLLFARTDRHIYVEILLFHLAIALMVYFLFSQLKNRITFSAFSYFTEGGYTIAAILTLFFSVLMLGKYSQIPFSCDDIDNFPQNLFQTSTSVSSNSNKTNSNKKSEPLPNAWDKFKGILGLPLSSSTTPEPLPAEPQKSEIELFFERSRQFLQTEVVDLQGSISKNSCEFVMGTIKKTQVNGGLQVAVILLMYFLLIGVFKIILWIISFIGFFIFLLLKPFKLYRYEKRQIEREDIR